MVTTELAASHTANRMDEVGVIQIFKSVLIRIMSVGPAVEVIRRRIFTTLLITCILGTNQHTCNEELKGTYSISFFVEHEGSDSPPGVGAVPGLTADTDSGTAPAVLILSSGDGTSGHRHDKSMRCSGESGSNRSG